MPANPNDPKLEPIKGPTAPAVDLNTAVTSLVTAIMAARVALDQETVQLAKVYQENEILRQFPPPAFGLSEVTLHLPYAAIDVKPANPDMKVTDPMELPHMLVQINADVLAGLPPHAVGSVELKLSPQLLSLLMDQVQG